MDLYFIQMSNFILQSAIENSILFWNEYAVAAIILSDNTLLIFTHRPARGRRRQGEKSNNFAPWKS